MTHVAHQCICMQYLLELAKQLETDPRACISSFFTKIQVADQDYKDAFYNELEAFKVMLIQMGFHCQTMSHDEHFTC